MRGKKIAWISPHPTHYNNFLFERIAASGSSLDLYFHYRVKSNYPWSTDFKTELNRFFLSGNWDPGFLKRSFSFKREYDTVVVAGWSHPTILLFLVLNFILGVKFALVTDTPKQRTVKGIRERLRVIFLKYLFRRAAFVLLAGSRGMKTLIEWGCPSEKIHIFPFVTNLDLFRPAGLQNPGGSESICFFSSGRLDNQLKGYDVNLRAMARFKSAHPDSSFTYLIAGTGPDKKVLEQTVQALALEKEVVFLGWVEVDDLPALYQRADFFIHNGIEDPFPNAVLEAMASGTIVIASDTSGSALDRIKNGVNGFIHITDDIASLHEQMERALSLSAEERSRMRSAARATAESWGYTYHIDLLNKLI